MKEDAEMKLKAIAVCLMLLAALMLVTGCSQEQTPYQINDAENYSVSVKYDANGGIFTTNTSVIVDSYNISGMATNSEGKAEIALIAPDSAFRNKNAFTAINNGYFLAGWYTQRTETGTDSAGNPTYAYSGKWDFEKDLLTVDPAGTYTAAEPVVTLYAAWIPLFEIQFYDLASGELLESLTYDPTVDGEILIPAWDEETGAVDLGDFPERAGYTFNGAYYDEAGQQAIGEAAIAHPGTVDAASGTANDTQLKLYVDWTEGEWFHIYNVEQFLDNASVNGNYILHADLDFAEENWPTSLMHGSFGGTIQGNGHTIKNVNLVQTNNSKTNGGLFGALTETANISDLTLENVTFTIKSGTRMAGTCYGLLAGTISDQAAFSNVEILTSRLLIDSGSYFGTDDYTIGLLCGMGNAQIDYSGITCENIGENTMTITVDGNTVTISVG